MKKEKKKFGGGLTPFMLDLQKVYLLGAVFGLGLGLMFVNWQVGLLVAGLGFYCGYKIANEVEERWTQ